MEKAYQVIQDVISRKNQDDSIILMKLDESSLFYKINGVAALLWRELESPKTLMAMVDHVSSLFPGAADSAKADVTLFIEQLKKFSLINEVDAPSDMAFSTAIAPMNPDYRFGKITEFNLDAIETEVLNENIYLDVFAGSDLRLKKDITGIKNALEKVTQLNGVKYHWDEEKAVTIGHFGNQAPQAGLIAQDVAAVMPELVRMDAKTGYLAIEYSKLNSYLVEAIKELNQLIRKQENRITELEKKL
ncbi:MAG: PqqD family peptide modification chaperone [Bdellovibrionota bacterium]